MEYIFRALGDENGACHTVVFGLREKICRQMTGIGLSVGDDQNLRRTCDLEALDKALSDGNLERLSSGDLCIPESRFFISDSIIADL